MAFEFDKIYVIESLVEGERTGQELYNSVIQWFENLSSIGTSFHSVEGKEELISVLEEISTDCALNGFKPLIHLEIHGLPDKSGLALVQDLISWEELSFYLRRINIASRWNLNLTLAVCYGNYLFKTLSLSDPSPVAGFLGSFEEIFLVDFVPRFEDFYTTLRDNLSLDEAITAMMNENGEFVNGFTYIDARKIFANSYNRYLEEQFSPEALWRRYVFACDEQSITPSIEMFPSFVQEILGTREHFFERHKRSFFMIDQFPENEERFPIFLNEVL